MLWSITQEVEGVALEITPCGKFRATKLNMQMYSRGRKREHSKSSCTRGNLHPANPCSYWLFSYMERWQRENFFPTFFPSSRNQLDFAGTLFCYGISTLNGDRAKHPKLNSAIIWHLPVDYRWRVVRVVEGAGLENQCTFLVPRVRTPHSPPESNNESPERRSLF